MDRYIASDYHRDTTALYTYYRYVFDNVEITEDMLYVFADVYYTQDINYEEHAYGTLCLYDDESEWVPYKMTSADVAALKKLKEDYENVDINIFRSIHNVNLDTVIGYKQKGKSISFLDDYKDK